MSEKMTLGSACSLIVDCEHKTAPWAATGTEYAYSIGTPNIRNGRIAYSTAKLVDQSTYDSWTVRAIPGQGDIILTREAPVGEAAFVDGKKRVCLGQRTVLLRPNSSIAHSRYLHYKLLSPDVKHAMVSQAEGSTVPHLNVGDIRRLDIGELPDLRRQEAIASLLGALDDKITVNDHIARTSRDLGQAMFAGCLKFNTPQMVELAEVTATIARGITPNYSDDDDSVVVVNQKCVRDGRVTLDPARKTTPEKIREPKLLRRDDVLVNSTGVGTLGRVARWNLDIRATTDSHVTIVRFDSAKVDPVCGGFALLAAQSDIEALGEGSTGQTELSRKRLAEYQMTLPSPEAMQQLRPNLGSLEAKGEAAIQQSKSLAELRDALLPKLMSGQIKIRDAERVVEDAV